MGHRSSRPTSPKIVCASVDDCDDGDSPSPPLSCSSTDIDESAKLSESECSLKPRTGRSRSPRAKFSSTGTLKKGDLRALAIANKFMSTDSILNNKQKRTRPPSVDDCGSSVCSSSDHVELDELEESNFCSFSGTRIWIFHSGDVYNGEWLDGAMHGEGTLHLVNSRVVYRGEFCHGVYHGKGTMKYQSGDVFTGSFLAGVKHGEGRVEYASGKPTLTGLWKMDKLVKTFQESFESGNGSDFGFHPSKLSSLHQNIDE